MKLMNVQELNNYYSDSNIRFGFLQKLGNKYGNFRIFSSYKKNDQVYFSTWVSIYDSVYSLHSGVTHRTMYPFELVLDSDDELKKEYYYNLITQKIIPAVDCPYALFETGSKGYHLHLFFIKEYIEYITRGKKFEEYINQYKAILQELGFDTQKLSRMSPIAIEFAPHWKSGKQKKLLEERGGFYEQFD